ncbi:MAG: FtsX-like permease family protein [Deltaproteobacteria bacterium]|nr:FtsX-like permease family protein [Deltaproteobacteria bacterium]
MSARKLLRLVRQNLRRNRKHNILSSIGIVVGIAAFAFFLSLDAGVRKVVLGEIFPVDRLEVIPPKATLFGSGVRLDDALVSRLRNPPPEVGARPKAVFAKMKLAFPARGWGGRSFLKRDRDFYFEVSGFCDGVDEAILEGEVQPPFVFEDALSRRKPSRCGAGNSCPEGFFCAWDVYECHPLIPAVISRHMIELYNGSIAATHPGLPKIPDFAASLFRGKSFTVELGRSYLGSQARQGGQPVHRQFQLVGVSDKAIPLGLTVPIGYVKAWNRRYAGELEATTYSSVVMVVESKRDITALAAHVKSLGFDLAESQGERVGLFITLATILFTLISVIIVGISAINIAHTFMMLIADRRREIGVLRAVGATRGHIRSVVLGEAAVIGFLAGGLGLLIARAAAWTCDWYSAHRVPDFPFKPDTYFVFSPALVLGALGFAVLCCVLGALVPAQQAARLQPAEALATR